MKYLICTLLLLSLMTSCIHPFERPQAKILPVKYISKHVDTISFHTDAVEPDAYWKITDVVDTDESQFHIRVVRYGEWNYYVIHFTNDNWKTKEELAGSYDNPNALFISKSQAIQYAKQFKSYKQCLRYNEKAANAYHKSIESDKPVEVY